MPVIISTTEGHYPRCILAAARNPNDAKGQALRAARALNPHAAVVTDAAFVRRHKLRPEIVSALWQARADEPMILSSELAERVHAQFGVHVHRRTIERVLGPRPKRPTVPRS